jgi:ABC-3C biological conflict system middle component
MSSALTALEIVQNPALGAYALWRFGVGFQSDDGRPAGLPLAFLVLPLLLHQPTLKMIGSTHRASGLALFAAKLGQERENLVAVHERALALRRLSLQSLAMGVNNRLLTLDYNAATLRANTADDSLRNPTLPDRIRGFSGAAEKIGYWFSKLGLHQVASSLAVQF